MKTWEKVNIPLLWQDNETQHKGGDLCYSNNSAICEFHLFFLTDLIRYVVMMSLQYAHSICYIKRRRFSRVEFLLFQTKWMEVVLIQVICNYRIISFLEKFPRLLRKSLHILSMFNQKSDDLTPHLNCTLVKSKSELSLALLYQYALYNLIIQKNDVLVN